MPHQKEQMTKKRLNGQFFTTNSDYILEGFSKYIKNKNITDPFAGNKDLIIKLNSKIFLCEAKHLNTSGGGQDKQISELIEIISLKEKNKKIYYIAFLDGSYSNILLDSKKGGDKLMTQKKEIKKCLLRNPNNFWVNTAGFEALFNKK